MTIIEDCFGHNVRLTEERLALIVEHPEMKGMEADIERVLRKPQLVRRSRSDEAVRLFYNFYERTILGGKWLCVVVTYMHAGRRVCGHGVPDRQTKGRRRFMANKVKIWFDAEADYLEVQFVDAAGSMKETAHDALMERVDADGRVIGFSVMGVSRFRKDKPLVAELLSSNTPAAVREKRSKYGRK